MVLDFCTKNVFSNINTKSFHKVKTARFLVIIRRCCKMPLINGCKYSCEPCVRGHRATSCAHTDRVLVEVRKPGRPLQSCGHTLSSCSCGRVAETFAMENVLPSFADNADTLPTMVTPRSRSNGKAKPKSQPRSHRRQSKRARNSAALPDTSSTEQEDSGTAGETDIEGPTSEISNPQENDIQKSRKSSTQPSTSNQAQRLPNPPPQPFTTTTTYQSQPYQHSSSPSSLSYLLNTDHSHHHPHHHPPTYDIHLPPLIYTPSSPAATISHSNRSSSLSHQVSQNVYGNSNPSRSPSSWQQQWPSSRIEDVSMVPGAVPNSEPERQVRSQYILAPPHETRRR